MQHHSGLGDIMESGFQREVLERLTKIETKLDDYKEIKEKNEIAYTKSMNNEKDIIDIQDKLKWISRAIVGAVIVAIIGIVFSFLKIGIGLGG